MKKFLQKIGLLRVEKAMTLDEYIISIRPKNRKLSYLTVPIFPEDLERAKDNRRDDDNGPEEAGCLVLA